MNLDTLDYSNISLQEEEELQYPPFQLTETEEYLKKFLREETVLTEDSLVLNESYFGKNDDLVNLEKELQAAIDDIRKNNFIIGVPNNRYYAIIQKLQNTFKQMFNLEECVITWGAEDSGCIIYTIPITSTPFSVMKAGSQPNFNIHETPLGYQFEDNKGKIVCIYFNNGLFEKANINAAELIALLLHNIGHNFYLNYYTIYIRSFINSYISGYTLLTTSFGVIKAANTAFTDSFVRFPNGNLAVTREGKKVIHPAKLINNVIQVLAKSGALLDQSLKISRKIAQLNMKKKYKENPNEEPSKIVGASSVIVEIINVAMKLFKVFSLKNLTFLTKGSIQAQAINAVHNIAMDSYRDDKFSDNFVTSYGYAKEYADARVKMAHTRTSLTENMIKELPYLSHALGLMNLTLSALEGFSNPEPSTEARIYDQIRMCEAELNKTGNIYPRKVRRDLEFTLESLKADLASMKKYDKQYNYFRYLFTTIRDMVFKAKDLRQYVYKTKSYDWESIVKKDSEQA